MSCRGVSSIIRLASILACRVAGAGGIAVNIFWHLPESREMGVDRWADVRIRDQAVVRCLCTSDSRQTASPAVIPFSGIPDAGSRWRYCAAS